jgi:hypothetical protein
VIWLAASLVFAAECSYQPRAWSAETQESVPLAPVTITREALSAAEQGPLGCTPCEQDQVERSLSNGLRFRACHRVVDRLTEALEQALREGAHITSISVYRPIRSRGPLTGDGLRSELSEHAFGIAVDLNEEHNGLYDDCLVFGPGCRLLRGGPWDPSRFPQSLSASHPVVTSLEAAGWSWGGRLEGRQKDFMHFSLSPGN